MAILNVKIVGVFVGFIMIAGSLASATAANADEILCASKKDETIYFSTGQVRFTATVNSPTLLTRGSLTHTGNRDLGGDEASLTGVQKGQYVRFIVSGDAWCNYKFALPKDFMTRSTTPMYLDAYCEENNRYTVRLNCRVQ